MIKKSIVIEMKETLEGVFTKCVNNIFGGVIKAGMKKEDGIDGILVTVGLCIIALLLCVVMKDSLTAFINTIVTELTNEAKAVLSGVTP